MTRTRILLVHTDPATLAALRAMLPSAAFEIVEAHSDRTAANLLRNPPALVVHAVDPGDPDALDLLAYVRRKQPSTPVILLFGGSHPDRPRQAVEMGASAVLTFSLPTNLLRAAVAQALGSSGLGEAGPPIRGLKEALAGPERDIIAGALRAVGGNRTEAALALEIDRTTLYHKMKKYGLLDEDSQSGSLIGSSIRSSSGSSS